MIYLVFALLLLGIVAFVAGVVREKRLKGQLKRGEIATMPSVQQIENMECCGQHEVCEKESLLAAVSKQVEYYDDEELDRFRGVASDGYRPEDVEEFREVLYSMKDEDVAGWVRSLQLRAVELPNDLKDEIFMIVGERRM